MTTNTISFPNIGINGITVREVAFSVFGLQVRWYGIIITTAIIAAVLYVMYRAKQAGISSDDVLDFAIAVIVSGVVGARAYYVLTTLGTGEYKTFYDVIAIWNGGLAIYGGIIGGGLAAMITARIKKIPFLLFFDLLAPAVMMAQSIGRWANFINGEAYGSVSEYTFLGIKKTIDASRLPWLMKIEEHTGNSVSSVLAQPTFLYESLWNLIGFILINMFYKKKKYDGQIFFAYIAWYGFGRMFIEGMRTDSLTVGSVRISQLIGALCFAVGTVLFFIFLKKAPSAAAAAEIVNNENSEDNDNVGKDN
ncbi:MAG: prolipoprotein diacylglyceryl transferase [Clostridia bacterium]|nr:prolipoprotein diacylglyceryl transferase [Clostridia bacterium]